MMPALHPPRAARTSASGGEEALAAILDALAAGDGVSRCHAARALARIGSADARSAQALIAALDDSDPDVRAEAVAAAGHLRLKEAALPVIRMLQGDPAGAVRIEAASALGHIGTGEARSALLACFRAEGYPGADDPASESGWAPEVQSRSLEALSEIGDARDFAPLAAALGAGECDDFEETMLRVLARLDRHRATDLLLLRLRAESPRTRRRAARALAAMRSGDGRLPAEITQPLLEALLDGDAGVRIEAARGLAASGEPGAHVPLTLLLGDGQPEVRAEGARLLGALRSDRLVERLHALLADPALRRTAVRLLGEIGDPRSAAPVEALLDIEDPDLRFDIVATLGAIGTAGCEAKLAPILGDAKAHHTLRAQAARSLGRVLGRSRTWDAFGEHLNRAALDPDGRVAQAALCAIADADPRAAGERLAGLLEGELESEPARTVALRLIGGCAGAGSRVLGILRRGCEAESPALRRDALGALARTGDSCAPPLLVAALGDSAPEVRLAALNGLVALGRIPKISVPLAELCRDADLSVRALAVGALASAEDASEARRLLRAALEDEHPEVARAALRALAGWRGIPDCGDALARLALRFRGDLRREAAAALATLEGRERAVARMLETLEDPAREDECWIAIDILGELLAGEAVQ